MAAPIRDRERTEGSTLGSLCEDLGPELLEVVTAPAGVGVPITEVVLHDALEAIGDAPGPGRLLLVIGHSGDEETTERLLRSASAAGVAALACRNAASLSKRVLATAERSTPALLCVPENVEWSDLFQLVDAAIGVDRRLVQGSTESGGSGLEDLFALAETVARIAGGPVTIDDAQSRILAFSAIASRDEVDEARLSTILNRRVQEPWRKEMLERGILHHLLSSRDVMHVDSSRPDKRARRVIAVCHGTTVLGSIWLAGDSSVLSPDADEALCRAAPIAAYLMMRQRIGIKAERRLLESHVATLLRDGDASPGSLERVGLIPGQPVVTVAVEAALGNAGSPAPSGPRIIDLLSMELSSYTRAAVVCPAQVAGTTRRLKNDTERIYILATCTEGHDDRVELQRIMTDCVRYASRIHTGGLRAGIGYQVDLPEDVPSSRRSAEECLELSGPGESVTMYEKIQARSLLAAVDHVVADWRPGPSAAFTALLEYDEQHNAGLVGTLTAVLDHAGDTMKVAQELHLHANSVRYRVKRAAEIAGVDLDDADARLALQLELRART
jgi:PucR C-terminal helix-turn-helix domain/Purine catabolism regulatory protein-like family